MTLWRELRDSFEGSLRTRVLVGVLLSALIAIGLSALLHVHSAYEDAQRELDSRANRTASIMADALARPLFDFNVAAVASAVEALGALPDVAAIRVLDASGAEIATSGNWSGATGDASIRVQRAISYLDGGRSTAVGRIELLLSRRDIRAAVINDVVREIQANLVFALMIVAVLLFASGQVGRQFTEAVAALDKLKNGDVSIEVSGAGRKDEVGRLSQAVESFRDALIARKRADDERERLERELSEERERVAREALDRSEAQYRLVVENVAEGILVVQDGRIVLANPRVERLVGRPLAEIRSVPFVEFIHPEDRAMVLDRHVRRMRGEGIEPHYPFRVSSAAGETIWVELSAVVIEWQGKPATLSFLTDITERKRLEDELQRTLAEREVILENSVVGIALLNPHGRMQWANTALAAMFGQTREASLGSSLEPYYLSREEYLRVGGEVSKAVMTGDAYNTELRMRRADGGLFWVSLSGKAVNREDLSQGTVWVIVDITRRRDLEDRLKRTTLEQEIILQSTQIGITHTIGRVHQYVNATFARMVGYDSRELVGYSSRLHFPDEASWASLGEDAYPVIGRGESFVSDRQFMRKNGEVFWVQMIGKAVDPEDLGKGAIWTVLDITQQRQAEDEVRAALERQRELNELKSRFVSMTSHEFRTPLATIQSSTELLKYYRDRLPDSEKTDLLQSIADAVKRMTRMLDNVLTIGRADAGRLEFNPGPVDIVTFCRTLASETARAADVAEGGGDERLIFSGPSTVVIRMIDENLLRHVLGNLLTNAFKYSPGSNPVEFGVVATQDRLAFSVRDHGIGIPEEDQARLFETFHRATNVGNIPGTGLGMSIVQRALNLHGGTIAVESSVGVGTVFRVEVPAPSC